MKFSRKMILCVTFLLAMALSVSGYVMVRRTMDVRLAQETADSQRDMQMFGVMLQSLTDSSLSFQTESVAQAASRLLTENPAFQTGSFGIWNGEGALLAQTGSMPKQWSPPKRVTEIETSYFEQGETTYLISAQSVRLQGAELYIACSRDVTSVFTDAKDNLNLYQIIMAVILVVCVGLTTAFTLVLTRPIRRISRTARQLSQGHYEKRVKVDGDDELQLLARDFNAMADSLQKKMDELSDALQRQKDFTAGFAHELKTPLTSVIGYADTLRSRELPRPRQIQAADYIFREGKRLEAMSFALLDLFALDRKAPEFSMVPVTELVRQTAESCAYLLQRDGITLERRVQEATLYVSPELLKTLLYNLIDNARKASKRGDRIFLTGDWTENGYRLSVRDQGCGMEPAELTRITEAFYMVDKARARGQGGAGLGLALCQKIAEVHHGCLEFHSAPGEGTEAILLLEGGAAQ